MTKIFGYLVIFLSIVFLLNTIVFTISYIALRNNIILNNYWFKGIQRTVYYAGFRNMWQTQRQCVEYDKELIYIPKIGSCVFKNLEFDTVMNYNQYGRTVSKNSIEKNISNENAIAVLGDSQAMGWEVNDDETFSFIIQKKLKRKVFNQAVSSYGTKRELIRYVNSGLNEYVNTILIQYGFNDLKENLSLKINNEEESLKKFGSIFPNEEVNLANRIIIYKNNIAYFFSYFFDQYTKTVYNFFKDGKTDINFRPHYKPLIDTIAKFDELKDKNIVIFYINDRGKNFYNYPVGVDINLSNIRFIEISLDEKDFFVIDDHLNKNGHNIVANNLLKKIFTNYE